jgi:transposase
VSYIPNFINMPWLTVNRVDEHEFDYHVYVEMTDKYQQKCPDCGSESSYKHGTMDCAITDTCMHGKRVIIDLKRGRLKCRDCGKTYKEEIPEIIEKRRVTVRAAQHIFMSALERTFTSVANELGLHEKTVRNIFSDYSATIEALIEERSYRIIGLDEVHLNKQMRFVLTDIENNAMIDMLPTRTKAAVITRLMALNDRDKVEIVNMDMWRPYRDAAAIALPNAVCVVDKFHVVKMANEAVDNVRKRVQKDLAASQRKGLKSDAYLMRTRRKDLSDRQRMILSGWTNNYQVLSDAYYAKEAFYEVWDCRTREHAEGVYDNWKECLPQELRQHFHPIIRAIDNWRLEVFNYFDYRTTNAYTESLNSIINVRHRMGRGYSFEVLRSLMIISDTVRVARKSDPKPKLNTSRLDRLHRLSPLDQLEITGAKITGMIEELKSRKESTTE